VGNLVRTGDGSIAGAAGGAALRGGMLVSNGEAPNVEVRSKSPAAVSGRQDVSYVVALWLKACSGYTWPSEACRA
jgi:hypothetical protein